MITRHTSKRVTKCRSCNKNIPANTESYYVASVGNANTNVFVCKDCVYDLVMDVSSDFESFDALGQEIVMRKLDKDN